MKNKRTKQVGNYQLAQYRFMFLWFIPTFIWRTEYEIVCDIVGGWYIAEMHFKTEEETIEYLKEN